MPIAQTVICKCTKCFWHRTITYGDTQPFLVPDRCPICGSPVTSSPASPLDHALGALPLAAALAVGALALDALLKLAGKKGD